MFVFSQNMQVLSRFSLGWIIGAFLFSGKCHFLQMARRCLQGVQNRTEEDDEDIDEDMNLVL